MSEQEIKANVMDRLSKFTDLIKAIRRPPPPEQGDGVLDKPLTSSEVSDSLIKDIEALGLKESVEDIVFTIKLLALGTKPLDDSQFQLERIVRILSKLPSNSNLLHEVEKLLISVLWSDISKPPNMWANDFYRSADGSNYSRVYPGIGKSYSHYSRNVRIDRPPLLNVPDPETLFDTLMVRKGFKPHPSSISSMLFYLATIITHDLFDSSPNEPHINQSSSYLDLSPLYGRNLDEQMRVRQGRLGLLKPDTFSDLRIILQPPGVCCLLVLFSRNHNYIAKRLLQINENGRFSVKDPNDPEELKIQDENLFQTARLVNGGLYLHTILHDYLHTILGLNKTNSEWYLDPTSNFPKDTLTNPTPTGMGNQIALEFNYIYRWHPAISKDDETWIDDQFKRILGKDYPKEGEEIPVPVFTQRLKEWRESLPSEPEKRTFGGLERIKEGELKGTFRDTDLVKELVHATDQVAANGVPRILRVIEILGIKSARKMGVCSLNELRSFLNLEPYKSFEDMNPDEEVAKSLRLLYGHVDNVELYPGVIVEKTKPPMIGSGICINYTISRTILSDAVNLVRNDRFNSDELNPHNLTNWGYNDIQSDPKISEGNLLYRLLLRNTQGCYKPNSVYAMFPFVVPAQTKKYLETKGTVDQYDYSTPAVTEQEQQKTHVVRSYRACHEILSNKDAFNVVYDPKMKLLMRGVGYFLGFDDTNAHDRDRTRLDKAFYPKDSDKFFSGIRQFFLKTTQDLIDKKKITFDGKTYQINAVRDVCNLAPVHFVSEYFGVPLKTQESPHGVYTEQEVYFQLTIIFMYIFVDTDPADSFKLSQTAKGASEHLHDVMQKIVEIVSGGSTLIEKAADSLIGADVKVSPQAEQLIKILMSQYKDSNLATWNIIGTISGAVAILGEAASLVVEFYLRPENKSHLEEIRKLAEKSDEESEKLILGYVLEALRFNPSIPGLFRRATESISVDNGSEKFNKDELIFLSLSSAHMDPSVFPEPDKINPRRPSDSYLTFGYGFHRCFAKPVNFIAIPTIVKTILKLKNLQRASGRAGQINQIKDDASDYISSQGTIFSFPTDMVLNFTN
ncbi:903_t:CDS:2 [Funneliformis geosporum]|uniref:8004_t:CDS:1 n=1 Tax=Funneliformis geosporum TaxID=1117311 RepID=A0A9W4WWN0_9GLOM|nr:903_t:CDS:2 [Funneliformis geosporum]CAI2177721.1 8004_t:CDS:2 [Funneliformis geosporum]